MKSWTKKDNHCKVELSVRKRVMVRIYYGHQHVVDSLRFKQNCEILQCENAIVFNAIQNHGKSMKRCVFPTE